MPDTDVLVVGGGPVGLGAAIEARLAGLRVTLAEPRTAPVDKACGEGLMPPAVAALAALGVRPEGRPYRGIRYVDGARSVDGLFRRGPGLGVRRTTLHTSLAARADEIGVRRVPDRVGRLEPDADGVTALGVPGADGGADGLRARWVLAADGLHSAQRRALGLDRPPGGVPRYGLRRHFAVAPWSDLVEVHWSPRAEAYVTPVAEDLVGVAFLFRGSARYEDLLAAFPELVERLAGIEAVTPVMGAGPLHQLASAPRAGRVLLVGDAGGYLDALTGEGVAVGLATARAAVAAIAADRPEAYDDGWRRATRRYRTLTGALLWASSKPVLRRRLVPLARRLPRVYTYAVNAVCA